MKKVKILLICIGIVVISVQFSSCKTGEGCGLEEKYSAKTDGDGQLTSKRGSSNLFSKKTRKKMKSGGR